MLFNSFEFLFFFLAVLVLYWRSPQQWRVPLLLIVSYLFYMAWSPPFGIIYAPVIFFDSLYFYVLSRAMVHWPQFKKPILIFGITTELLLLGYFKYTNFLIDTVNNLMAWGGSSVHFAEQNIFLPLAISFTNFILISYLVDIYRGDEKPDPSFLRFATYVGFFPHLIAGPIVRASELLHQFDQNPKFELPRFAKGFQTFWLGFAIKVLVADMVAPTVEGIFDHPAVHGFNTSWLATYCFAAQILCDFWGYTLMAQGSALIMGYSLPDNFNAPYFAKNITEFWRRWHMSLSRWLKDYLYIPLGGSRGSKFETYRNLFLTMGLGGLWHGASWNFVIWGVYQGLLLTLHKAADYLKINRLVPGVLAIALTFHMVCLGWVFFRAKTFELAVSMVTAMTNVSQWVAFPDGSKKALLLVMAFFAIHAVCRWLKPRLEKLSEEMAEESSSWLESSLKKSLPVIQPVFQTASYFLLFYLSLTLESTQQEFIYFQF